jgi:predicted AAA+ superfamily ATPase
MRSIVRVLAPAVEAAARAFPAIVLTGPRRAGKTYLLRRLRPKISYFLFEDPDVVARFRADPQGFLDGVSTPAILDEVQNVPEIFGYVRARIDRRPRHMGDWFLTGSQEVGLMRGVSESMAGRAAILQLLPFSLRETSKVNLLDGGYPEVLSRPRARQLWFSSYLQTYLERDVRSIMGVRDLAKFRHFMALVASRHGQVLNRSDLAAPLGMSVPAINAWLDVLEMTAQIWLIPPYFENLGKRLIKSPKLYLADSGLACHLLGLEKLAEIERSPFLGSLFEGFVASEIAKAQAARGQRRQIYHFRDQQGLEVDFVVPGPAGSLLLLEAKATRTPQPEDARPLEQLARSFGVGSRHGSLKKWLVHRSPRSKVPSRALVPGVSAIPIEELELGHEP